MTDESIDVRVHFKDSPESEPESKHLDRVSVNATPHLQAPSVEQVVEDDPDGESAVLAPKEDRPVLEDADDEFEWSEEREQAIMDALEFAPEGTTPTVHKQLEDIARALELGELEQGEANRFLDEVDAYLDGRIAEEQKRLPVINTTFMEARSDKQNALFSYKEASVALRAFCDGSDKMQLKVARYALEQGCGFLNVARDTILDAEPEFDEDDDEYEDEESFEDDEDDYQEDDELEFEDDDEQ